MSHKKKHIKEGELEQKVQATVGDVRFVYWKQMSDLAEKYNVPVNDIFCGYLWQPISYTEKGATLNIYGGCSLLDGKPCQYTGRPVEDRYSCPVYKARFPE